MTTMSTAPASTQQRPTMRDVAALAGVSLKTVSRVVNDEPGVSPELAKKVQLAIDRLDYRPNLGASSLRRSDRLTRTLGLLLEVGLDETFDRHVRLGRACRKRAKVSAADPRCGCPSGLRA